ncbi:MAG: hypothetical protein H0T14_06185 [Nocardioidaceae bacterium]|nr:hypothetical protein [Nocardioidaceae bacterium]
MSEATHPTLDEIADLYEQLLEPDVAEPVQAHIDVCARCAAQLEALDAVSVRLAEIGAERAVMPASVMATLDSALGQASAERTAGVTSLADRRTAKTPRTSPASSRRRPAWMLVAAAAVAAVIAVPVGFELLPQGASDESSSADAGQAETSLARQESEDAGSGGGQEGAGAGTTPESDSATLSSPETTLPARLTPRNLVDFALGAAPVERETSSALAKCAGFEPFSRSTGDGVVAATARWRGERAVVLVDRRKSSVAVYGCATPGQLLYSTAY